MSYDSLLLGHSPIGHWELAEPSGTTMEDSSSNNRDGTYSGGVTLGQTGLLTDGDTAAAFDGSNDYGQVAAASLPSYTALTAIAWFKPGRLTADNPILIRANYGFGTSSTNYSFHLRWSPAGSGRAQLHVGLGTTSGWTEGLVGSDLSTSKTYMAALTYDGAAMKAYLGATDGALTEVQNVAKSGTLWTGSGQPLRVGADAGGFFFAQGTIGKTAVIDDALTATELEALFDAGIAAPSGPTATVDLTAPAMTSAFVADVAGETATVDVTAPAMTSALVLDNAIHMDVSNGNTVRRRVMRCGVEVTVPVEPVPAGVSRAESRDKAVAYTQPTMVNGRPT